MRKFFSLIAAVLFAGSMMASVVTLDPSTQTDAPASSNAGDPIELTINGITIAYQGAVNASTAPADFRVYANQNLTLSATSNISKVTIAGKANKAGWAPTVSAGEITTGASYEGITTKATLEDPLFVVENINAQSISITCNKQLRAYMIEVTLDGGDVPPTPTMDYYVAGSMTNWAPMAAYKLVANPANEGEYMGEFTFAANDEFKVGYSDGITIESTNYFPNGMDNNYVITEAGDYTVYFRPDGQGGEDWHYGCINAIKKVIPQYEVAEAIAAGLTDDTEILVRGVITKMEFKGKNFAKYGSVNIYVADATGAEGAFEFYNCYSLNADTFRTSDPAYDAESTSWAEYDEVADENGNAIHVGDTVIAFGKYKLYSGTHELNTGCYLTEIKHPGDAPVEEDNVIYDWAGEIGTTILGASGVEVSTVKIHTNTETVPAIKFGSSYVYADGKWIAIKPAEGGFKAGDVLSVAAVYSNDATDGSKYAQVDVYAADGETRLFRGDSVVNGKKSADDPVVENYVLEADQDSLLLGRYGNTGMFVTMLKVVREGGDVPPTPEHTYTVVGGSAPLFGNTWDPAYEANNMEPITGSEYLYAWKKEGVALTAGTIEYKVCQDHGWATAWPAQGNYNFTIDEAGLYDVTIFFNPELETPTQVVAEFKGAVVVLPNIILHGNFTGSWADTEAFTPAADSLTASLTLALAEGTYEFGFKFDGAWTANGANLTREANTTNLAEGTGNMHIAADVAGDYVFTYTYETQILEVVYPDAPVVPDTITIDIESEVVYTDMVAAQGWWQFMAENDEYEISISNISTTQAAGVYTVADLDADYTYVFIKADSTEVHFVDGSLTLTEGEDGSRMIEGVMTGDDGNIYNIKLVFRIPTAETTVNVEIPEWGVYDGSEYYGIASYVFAGEAADSTYVQIVIPGTNPVGQFTYDDVYARGTGIEVGGEYKAIYSMNITINVSDAGRAIITADILCYNNTLYHVTTIVGEGVDNIDAAVKAIKRIVNGQVVIEKAGKTYNMNGAVIR